MSEPLLPFSPPLTPATLLRRYKRFLADVRFDDGREIVAHCPSPGGMLGLDEPGSRVWLSHSDDPRRKLAWTWVIGSHAGTPVGIHALLSNRLIRAAAEQHRIPELAGYATVRPEVKVAEGSRIDLLLEGHAADPRPCYVEIKTVTLAVGTCGLFPDAVTKRGLRHLRELQRLAREGARAVLLLHAQRADLDAFAPADAIDPAWGEAFREVLADGVEVVAVGSRIDPHGLDLGYALRVVTERP